MCLLFSQSAGVWCRVAIGVIINLFNFLFMTHIVSVFFKFIIYFMFDFIFLMHWLWLVHWSVTSDHYCHTNQ